MIDPKLPIIAASLTVLLSTGLAGTEVVPAPPTPAADHSVAPRAVVAAARAYVAREWPDVDLKRWFPLITFHSGADDIYGKPSWLFSFEGTPPVHSRVDPRFKFKIEYNLSKPAYYGLTLDEHGKFLGNTVIQQ